MVSCLDMGVDVSSDLVRRVSGPVISALTVGVLALGVTGPTDSGVSHEVARGASRSAALRQLESLPVAAQSVISSTVGSARTTYVARRSGDGWRLAGGGVAASLGAVGVDVRAGGQTLSFGSPAVGRGSSLRPVDTARPSARANRVMLGDRAVREWYAAGPLGIEQGFTLARRPAGTGAVVLSWPVGGSLRGVRSGSELHFLTASGQVAVRYGGLVAIDRSGRRLPASLALRGGRLLLSVADRGARYPLRIDPFIQVGAKLTGIGETGPGEFGSTVALSADGNTALIGGPIDNSSNGAAWIFTRTGETWTQEGPKLTPNDETGAGLFGAAVALSADGNTALIGGAFDNGHVGAAWVFTRSGSTWTQQGTKLTADDETGSGEFGIGVALSADGNTALIGGRSDNTNIGAAWAFTRSGATWTQQGSKLTASDETGAGSFGQSVALSADGNTALIGGRSDNGNVGAAWAFTRSGSTWTQQGSKLTASDETGNGLFGDSVALSADGNTGLIGGIDDNSNVGAVWVFTRSGSTWTQQGSKLSPGGATGIAQFGSSVSLSGDGNTALIGGPVDNTQVGAAWVYTRSGQTWTQQGAKLVPSDEVGAGVVGTGVALSADGGTAMIGGQGDNSDVGAAWAFGAPLASSPTILDFGSQTTAQRGPLLWLPVQNSGQSPLTFTGPASISGTNPSNFVIPAGDDLCNGQTLAPNEDCWIGVQFTAGATGALTATLTLGANNTLAAPPTIALNGTGVAANTGPQGTPGQTGPQGTPGQTGPQGKSGEVEVITCKTVTVHHKRTQRCTGKLASGPVKFTTSIVAQATLSRHRTTYARGVDLIGRGRELLLTTGTKLRPGRYTLTLTWTDQHHLRHATHQILQLG